ANRTSRAAGPHEPPRKRTTDFARSSVQADEPATRSGSGEGGSEMIVKREWRSTVVSALAILFLSQALSVWAHDFSRGAFRRTGAAGRRGPHSGGLLLRLIYPCRG